MPVCESVFDSHCLGVEQFQRNGHSTHTHMPTEMVYEILLHLQDDSRMLKACVLVNKSRSWIDRFYLFHSLDFNFILSKSNYDCMSLLLNMPPGLGDYVQCLCIKGIGWAATHGPGINWIVRALRHLAPKATTLEISDSSFSNFLDVAKIVCSVKQLRSLTLQNVNWTTDTFEPTELEEYNLFVPKSLSSLGVYYLDTGSLLGWFSAHSPAVIPKITTLYFGPTYSHLEPQIARYICNHSDSFVEFGMLSNPRDGEERPFYYRTPTIQEHVCHGYHMVKMKNGVEGCPCLRISFRLRILRFHDFLTPSAAQESRPGPALSTFLIPRSIASVIGKFCGTLILDVRVDMVSQVDLSMVDWVALENVLSHEAYNDMKEVVFKTWTDISLAGLENLIARMIPRAYSRGILKFERESNIPFES